MVRHWVQIYLPKDNNKSYDYAGFTGDQISFGLGGLPKGTAANETEALQLLHEIRSHSSFAAIVPGEFAQSFAHEFLDFAMQKDHPATTGIAIRTYQMDTSSRRVFRYGELKPIHQLNTVKRHAIATLKLFHCQFESFKATGQNEYTIFFKVTGGDKLVPGAEPGEMGDFEFTTEEIVNKY